MNKKKEIKFIYLFGLRMNLVHLKCYNPLNELELYPYTIFSLFYLRFKKKLFPFFLVMEVDEDVKEIMDELPEKKKVLKLFLK